MKTKVTNYKGTGLYIITERLYSRGGPDWHGLGASIVQVHKMVYQLYQRQDIYLEGQKITPDTVTLWQRLKILSGAYLVRRSTANQETCFSLYYAGSRFMATPVSGVSSKKPAFLTREYKLPGGDVMALGRDPLSDVNIYGRQEARFIMPNSGKDHPVAAAKHDKKPDSLCWSNPFGSCHG
ncbi:hypothetical protein [Erwinia sp. 198]|uniref:hypothetical protein n=1 Tax=Erwinia sp. 198 TaxID=2022746 RepID=UPI001F1FC63E|nr:hypothetical protein [Erwinia sp. 198]